MDIPAVRSPEHHDIRKGTNEVSTNCVTANVMLFDRGTFWTPVNLFVFIQKCQGVPFSPICQNHYFCSGPISVDLICLQPRYSQAAIHPSAHGRQETAAEQEKKAEQERKKAIMEARFISCSV